jgi:hypothetical protein
VKIKFYDGISIVILVVFVACIVENIRLHLPLSKLIIIMMIMIPIILGRYYWGSQRGEFILPWLGVTMVELLVALTYRHEGINVVAYPFMALGIVTLIGTVVVHRVKRGYYPGIYNWFSTKGLPKH